jgi:hypothetical protein
MSATEKKEKITLEEHIAKSELVQIAILEAVHRYYFDECFVDGRFDGSEESQRVSQILTNLWCLIPDWRLRLFNATKRYSIPTLPNSNTKLLGVFNKPKKIFDTNIDIKFNEKNATRESDDTAV